jgi:transcriptional regulator with XRE-family HTH domain
MTGSQNIIGPHVRRLRCQQGLTQEQLAELAELSVPYISEVERGKKTISVDALYRISCALKVRLTTLFKEVPLEPRSKRAIEKVRT